jgi:hypothetical protein
MSDPAWKNGPLSDEMQATCRTCREPFWPTDEESNCDTCTAARAARREDWPQEFSKLIDRACEIHNEYTASIEELDSERAAEYCLLCDQEYCTDDDHGRVLKAIAMLCRAKKGAKLAA